MKKVLAVLMMLALAATLLPMSVAADQTVIVSDTDVTAYGPLTEYKPLGDSAWGEGGPAALTYVHPNWENVSVSGAEWISTAYEAEYPTQDTWRKFTVTFELCEGAYNTSGTLYVTSDNAEEAYHGGVLLGTDGDVTGGDGTGYEWYDVSQYSFTPTAGVNTLSFIVRNYAQSGGSYLTNPTGLLFRAEVTYDCVKQVDIDIKPGSHPNSFNINGNGVIPVAILGSADFDVTQIDVSTLSFGGLDVRVKGNGTPQCSIEDVSGANMPYGEPDGYDDLVCQFEDDADTWTPDNGTATVTGELYDGTRFEGTDEINLVP